MHYYLPPTGEGEEMKKWRCVYQSMTAFYEMGTYYADTKEEAERECRAKASAFSSGEKTLIKAIEVKD